jgi:N,N'-diacetyllegionaminate synthase
MKTIVIAEIGVNHNGSIFKAKKLIDIAKKANADFVKFQSYIPDEIVTNDLPKLNYQKNKNKNKKESMKQLLDKYYLNFNNLKILKNYSKKKKINFLCSPFGEKSFLFIKKLRLNYIKIASGEITNFPLLKLIAKYNKIIFLSTGMSYLNEVSRALNFLIKNGQSKKKIYLLHCTTQYPTLPEDTNLNAMITLKKKFKIAIGYSDHTTGCEASLCAVSLGAKVIEKHLTLDKKMEGPDHKASLEPEEFIKFVKKIRNIEKMRGSYVKTPTAKEKKILPFIRKSIVAKTQISKGELFSEKNITAKRSNGGVSAINFYKISNKKKAKKNFQIDDIIEL